MTTLILCGGHGLRIKGHFNDVPKSLVPIHGEPLLHHIIEKYTKFNVKHFVLLVGNNEQQFREFAKIYDESNINVEVLQTESETPTGGRIKKAEKRVKSEPFFLTYGDGVANIDFEKQLQFHQQHGKIATLTAVKPQVPFGLLDIDASSSVRAFTEKPVLEQYVNGGFFILNNDIFSVLNEHSDFETEILPLLSYQNQLKAFTHNGFWQNMDTYKDYLLLEQLELEKILF